MDIQAIFREIFHEASQEIGESPLEFYIRLKAYCIHAYPVNQFGEVYPYNTRMLQFVVGLDPEMAAFQTIKETDELMTYMFIEKGYI